MTTISINDNITATLNDELAVLVSKLQFDYNTVKAMSIAERAELRSFVSKQMEFAVYDFDGDMTKAIEDAYWKLSAIENELWEEENGAEARKQLKAIEERLEAAESALDWYVILEATNYSDRYKDVWGVRPRWLKCPFENSLTWEEIDAEIKRRYN